MIEALRLAIHHLNTAHNELFNQKDAKNQIAIENINKALDAADTAFLRVKRIEVLINE